MDPRTLSDADLEQHIKQTGTSVLEPGAELVTEEISGYGWRSGFKVQPLAAELAPYGLWSHSVEGCQSRRQALEQLALFMELLAEDHARRLQR